MNLYLNKIFKFFLFINFSIFINFNLLAMDASSDEDSDYQREMFIYNRKICQENRQILYNKLNNLINLINSRVIPRISNLEWPFSPFNIKINLDDQFFNVNISSELLIRDGRFFVGEKIIYLISNEKLLGIYTISLTNDFQDINNIFNSFYLFDLALKVISGGY